MSLYAQWLSSILDTSDGDTKIVLEFMSAFDKLEYKNANITLRYARCWCQLSKYLFSHKEEQLSSDKIQMFWEVPERKLRTDVYWFEVMRACDLLSAVTMENLLQDLQIITAIKENATKGYAQTAIHLPKTTMAQSLESIKSAIGVCQYTLKTAAVNCKYLTQYAPETMETIGKRYHSFRVIGCWLQGMYQLVVVKSPKVAADWFETAKDIESLHKTTPVVVPLIFSAPILQLYGFIVKAVEDGERGLALAYLREAKPHSADNPAMINRLEGMTKIPQGAATPAIPAASSPLMRLSYTAFASALENGTPPLENSPFKKKQV